MEVERFAAISLQSLERISPVSAAPHLGRCHDTHARAQVLRIELEEIDRARHRGLWRVGCLDDEPLLPRGVDVEALLVDKTHKRMAGKRGRSPAYPPYIRIVLPAVHRVEIVGLKRPQSAYRTLDVHPARRLESDDLVVYEHRHTPCVGVLRHLRLPELRVAVDEVERILVRRRLERKHDEVARRREVAAHDDSLGVEGVDQERYGLAQLLAHLLDKLDREVVVVLGRRDDVVNVYLLAAVVLLAQDGVNAALDELDDLLLDGDTRHLGLEASLLAAGTDLLVVEEGYVSALSRAATMPMATPRPMWR